MELLLIIIPLNDFPFDERSLLFFFLLPVGEDNGHEPQDDLVDHRNRVRYQQVKDEQADYYQK